MKSVEIAGLAILGGIAAIVFAAALMNHPLGGEPVAIVKVKPPVAQVAEGSAPQAEGNTDAPSNSEPDITRDGIFPGMIIGHIGTQ